jgi:hypothetical protein
LLVRKEIIFEKSFFSPQGDYISSEDKDEEP